MVLVKINDGILEGEVVNNEYGDPYCSFKGIPYAEPPVGELRFKAPRPPKPWTGVRSAKSYGPQCYQYDMFQKLPPHGSEDCLYLNVYTPSVSPPEPLPVMFWIHGGGFVSGNGEDSFYSPEYLIRHGVILVTFNYRLEVLGFLCLDTEDIPGNAGMKDQVAALRWVNQNIAKFGGDPNNITIFGESAGGASVGYHLVSPMTKGLFKRAIAQSGNVTCWWSYTIEARERAIALAKNMGCSSEDNSELYKFFKTQPVKNLILANAPITLAEKDTATHGPQFVIVSEKKIGENERFYYGDFSYKSLVESIHEDVEIYTGFTTDDGLIAMAVGKGLQERCSDMSTFYENFLPKPIANKCSITERLEVGKKLKQFYFNKKDIEEDDFDKLVKFYSAELFTYGIIQLAKMIANHGRNKVYLYQFSCISDRNHFTNFWGLEKLAKGKPMVCHCDDLLYLFDSKIFPKVDKKSDTFKLIDKVAKIWTNIAKNGNPTPVDKFEAKWSPYTLETQQYLDIGNELAAKTAPHEVEIQFWERIFRRYAPDYVH